MSSEPFLLYNNSTVHVPLKTRMILATHDNVVNYELGTRKTYHDTQYKIKIIIKPKTNVILYARDKIFIFKNETYVHKTEYVHRIGIINSIKVMPSMYN